MSNYINKREHLIHVYSFKTISYKKYIKFVDYFRKKRKESILFCDHFPVITAGIQYKKESFKIPEHLIRDKNIDIEYVKRGGDVTAHEPGQIIIYPHIDIKKRKIPITKFIIDFIKITENLIFEEFHIKLLYKEDMPGLYTHEGEKIVSIGLEIRNGFTSSGIAINYQNDLKTFEYIYPCGFKHLKMNTIKNLALVNSTNTKFDDVVLNKKKFDFCKKWSESFISRLL